MRRREEVREGITQGRRVLGGREGGRERGGKGEKGGRRYGG